LLKCVWHPNSDKSNCSANHKLSKKKKGERIGLEQEKGQIEGWFPIPPGVLGGKDRQRVGYEREGKGGALSLEKNGTGKEERGRERSSSLKSSIVQAAGGDDCLRKSRVP